MPPKLTFYVWLLVPVALLAFHFGPGQAFVQRDEISRQLKLAAEAEKAEDWKAAMKAYSVALSLAPKADAKWRGKIRLGQAKARMYSGEIVEAIEDLKAVLADLPPGRKEADLEDEVRATLGAAEYYTTWLMRLEGAAEDEWAPRAESARQQYRFLSEDQLEEGLPSAEDHQKCLEAAIRLARMDLSELKAMPLPKFCAGCKNVSEKCRSQCESRSKPPTEKKPSDSRKDRDTFARPRGGS